MESGDEQRISGFVIDCLDKLPKLNFRVRVRRRTQEQELYCFVLSILYSVCFSLVSYTCILLLRASRFGNEKMREGKVYLVFSVVVDLEFGDSEQNKYHTERQNRKETRGGERFK